MSRRARTRAAAIEAKHVALAPLPVGDEDDDEPAPACGSCGTELEHAGDDCPACGEEN